jgi:DNA repair exonuclease SbcCD ATPase subunit
MEQVYTAVAEPFFKEQDDKVQHALHQLAVSKAKGEQLEAQLRASHRQVALWAANHKYDDVFTTFSYRKSVFDEINAQTKLLQKNGEQMGDLRHQVAELKTNFNQATNRIEEMKASGGKRLQELELEYGDTLSNLLKLNAELVKAYELLDSKYTYLEEKKKVDDAEHKAELAALHKSQAEDTRKLHTNLGAIEKAITDRGLTVRWLKESQVELCVTKTKPTPKGKFATGQANKETGEGKRSTGTIGKRPRKPRPRQLRHPARKWGKPTRRLEKASDRRAKG